MANGIQRTCHISVRIWRGSKLEMGREALCVRIVKGEKKVCDIFQKGLKGLQITENGQKGTQDPQMS